MPSKPDLYSNDLRQLLAQALGSGEAEPLEKYLTERSGLPGPRMNLAIVNAFAEVVGEVVGQVDPPVERLEQLLDGWAALTPEAAPVNDPREILPAAAVASYGQVAVVRPDWWEDEIAKLRRAASDPRWRVREMVAAALQRMLAADWERTQPVLSDWVSISETDPLIIRAAAAAIAEPPLLTTFERAQDALSIQAVAMAWLRNLPPERRQEEAVRTLRQALGYTLSVAVAATPETGITLINKMFTPHPDEDIQWIIRENLKKNRLKPWLNKIIFKPDLD